jgi:hypothetical protein
MQWSDDVSAGERLGGQALDGFESRLGIPHPDGEEGRIDAADLAAVAAIGARHTGTARSAWIAIWDGWGGVLGFYGDTPARTFLVLEGEDDADAAVEARHRQMLQRSIHDPVNNVFRRPVWQSGILSDEISRGPRLRFAGHEHVLFHGALEELADAGWPQRVPWAEERPEWTASPSIVWPDDRAWILVTDPDAAETVVAGSAALVAELSRAGVGGSSRR